MRTSANNITEQVAATSVRFEGNVLYVALSDGRELSVPLDRVPWLRWLAKASAEQRAKWAVEPCGHAIYWEELDDGVEIGRLLTMQPLT